jgi:predicted RNase H-like HicB family nuclease
MNCPAERRRIWKGEGVRLEIVAQQLADGQWSLSVVNERGVMSMWIEFFKTADEAIAAAITAIEDEGIEEFTSIEGFEYLDDESFGAGSSDPVRSN